MDTTAKSKQPQGKAAAENDLSNKLAEVERSCKGYNVDEENVLAALLADVQPGYEDEVVIQVDTVIEDMKRNHDDYYRRFEQEAAERQQLEAKQMEHAKVAIYYRKEQDKKYNQLRDLTMAATSRALEVQSKLS